VSETGQFMVACKLDGNIVAMQQREGEVIGPAVARTEKYPSDIREQRPLFACSGSNNEPERSNEGPETFPQQAMTYMDK
jgi:hypothetical protein